ncbi:MAG: SDR family NAD(P)-dependent oxidoreductase [Muribaculaceae bacterium]|nr:SDR family NAD(P)-dependent oxidoreductase [Bacteroides sp.]MDE6842332.1 SDR family NAD(P)-dependent oxidoreductase [Muribaculaceae bacterium]
MTNEKNMKRVIIVGASSGLGLGVAEALASRGVPVGLAARHTKALEALKKLYPDKIEYMSIDVTHHGAGNLLSELIDKVGGMDIYFHAAGIANLNEQDLDPETEAEVVRTNAEGFARMLSAAYNWFRAHGKAGQIAAITSVAGTNGIGHLAAYSASKRFDQTYMVALEQLSNDQNAGIVFTDIRPGWVKTPLLNPDQAYPMEMTVAEVVPQIIKAIVRRKRITYLNWRWTLLADAWRCIPDSVWTHMNPTLSTPVTPETPVPELDKVLTPTEEPADSSSTEAKASTTEK